ncbi:acylphosphatase [Allosphingosinicella vermicomposti]|uniref:acylphosphatase n=1 Tax=Allosphingosinicella vermicomposti TaxID=614671 RepID=UPI000D10C79E|nr:acylphosphatase [Allosphingosinicella vermicomposti]
MARRIVVRGKVQGVFYRAWTMETAQSLGITGWVRNRDDGTVELLAMGNADAVNELIHHLHEGPPAARVDSVEVEEATAEPLDHFEKRPTL